ncbi:MAG TPA: glycoside hydrolase family 15 protein, partial [Planctomycetota bacterium]|nr:glycoside hydrolase family 15 protein [Planctomycetota bacterium]
MNPPTTSPTVPGTRLHHGAIGNGRVLALVAPSSSIEWLCLPRFDSPAVFASLLDHERGGSWQIRAGEREVQGRCEYLRNTNVLCTTFTDGDAAWEVIDFAPRIPQGLSITAPLEVVRIVRPLRGEPQLRIQFDPRPDYGRAQVQLAGAADCIEVRAGDLQLLLFTDLPHPYVMQGTPFVLHEPVFMTLALGRPHERPTLAEAQHSLQLTVAGWRAWAKTCALPHFAAEHVLRSALCLKLHAQLDTGAIIAAATTSIPEAMGTERTWDYRYCWLRDAAFVVEALRRLSHLTEGEAFMRFLRDVAEAGPLQPVYGLDGRRQLHEELLPHLRGFDGNGHVRIGNSAWMQRQNDLMGELMLCLDTLLCDPRIVHTEPEANFPLVERLVTEAIAAAPTPDTGIWEYRTMLKHNTFSRAMCWVAIERGVKLARRFGHDTQAQQWASLAAAERAIVLERGFNKDLGFFTQTLDGATPDAANLLLPTIGLIDARDERFRATLAAYERHLVEGGMMLRYR